MSVDDLYQRIGETALRKIVAGFYARVPADPVLGPMYPPDDMAGAEKRLYGFIAQRFGGPQDYSDERGHPRLRMRHVPFVITEEARDHWILLMSQAIAAAELPAADADEMRHFLFGVAHQMQNR